MRVADEEDDDASAEMPAGYRLTNIINNLTRNRRTDINMGPEPSHFYTGDTAGLEGELKPRKRRLNGSTIEPNNNTPSINTHSGSRQSPGVKSERLSPGTPDTLSRSRSVTPSSASYPGTPPQDQPNLGRNYSDFMRSLAAKYNHTNPNDYFGGRNGYPFKPLSPNSKPKPDLSTLALLNPFAPGPFPPLIDMSSTQALLSLARTAREAEVNALRATGVTSSNGPRRQQDLVQPQGVMPPGTTTGATPLDLSAPQPGKKQKKDEDMASWTVDDVVDFVSSIDICAEYASKFRDQRIDGSGLPLLTEEHLTTTMGLKLGPALKLRSLLAKRVGSCSVCLHCVHCHAAGTSTPNNGSSTSSPNHQDNQLDS